MISAAIKWLLLPLMYRIKSTIKRISRVLILGFRDDKYIFIVNIMNSALAEDLFLYRTLAKKK